MMMMIDEKENIITKYQ